MNRLLRGTLNQIHGADVRDTAHHFVATLPSGRPVLHYGSNPAGRENSGCLKNLGGHRVTRH